MKDSNRAMLSAVADRLGPLLDRVVFVGGCATGLLVTDKTAPPIRSTEDVDVISQVASYYEYQQLAQELRHLGFAEDTRQGAPTCRWVIDNLTLDFMPTDPHVLGFSNRWYEPAIRTAVLRRIGLNREIRLITAHYFLATKLAAFENRGRGDYWGSRDMEDVVTVIDGRPSLMKEVLKADGELKGFLAESLSSLLNDPEFHHALPGYLPPDAASQGRVPLVLSRMKAILERANRRTT